MSEYITVKGYACGEMTEKKSRFIGHITRCESEEDALAFISEIRNKYRDATHNVFAYSIRENNITRASDDGEPQGTAGIPVLNVLKGSELCDVCIVVTRYFGGTLLGTGGLVKAYTESAKLAVSSCTREVMALCTDMSLSCDYDLYGKLEHYFETKGIALLSCEFTEVVNVSVRIKNEHVKSFEHDVEELTSARISPNILSQGWNPI